MKLYRELTLEGDPDHLEECLRRVEERLSDGWVRDREIEEKFEAASRKAALKGFADRAFRCPKTPAFASARLWIALKRPGLLYVPNVMPIDRRDLPRDEYNAIVDTFYRRFVHGPADETGIVVTLGPDRWEPSHDLPPSLCEELKAFSDTANRSLGSAHPSDRERWLNFIIGSHEAEVELERSMLEGWLVEDEGWPDDVARELVNEYEFGRTLLAKEHQTAAR